jgi:NAD(P)-dependent dehydrogenase (short-subunit alcohol dehydrogenase family)
VPERLEEARQATGAAEMHVVDVRDARAMRLLAVDVVRRHGRIDYLFNNAGVGVGGEVRYLTTAHWDRAIDINIRGVVNGVAAVYPIMVRQRGGTIVNSASLAGLAPLPLVVPYSMTKHAVVGLSRSLRLEAAPYGVRVSALCPVGVDTPMLDALNPSDLPTFEGAWRPHLRLYFHRLSGRVISPARFAEESLRGVERNRGIIVVPRLGMLRWWWSRTFTSMGEAIIRWAMNRERAALAKGQRPFARLGDHIATHPLPDPLAIDEWLPSEERPAATPSVSALEPEPARPDDQTDHGQAPGDAAEVEASAGELTAPLGGRT